MIHPVALLVLAMLAAPAQAQTRAVDRQLMDAGFVMRPADTPGKMKKLQALTPYKFVTRTKDGVRYYIYPDPTDCKCAFVGYQNAFDSYRDMISPPPVSLPGMREFRGDAIRPGGGLSETAIVADEMDEDAGLIPGDDIFHLKFD